MKRIESVFKFDDATNSLLEMAYAFQNSRILLTAAELGVFDSLGEEFKTCEELAGEIQCDAKSLEKLLNALCSLKLLLKKSGKYANSENSWNLLVRGNQHYIGNLSHFSYLWNRWSNLTDIIRTGERHDDIETICALPDEIENYIAAIHWRGQQQAPDIVPLVDLTKSSRLLVLGGKSGVYAMEFLKLYPHLDVTIYDQPIIIPVTQKYLEVKGFAGRINTLEGDFTKDKLPKNHYDSVFLSNVLMNYSFWEIMDILKNIYDALKIGGKIVIHELLLEDNRYTPELACNFSVNQLVTTKSGDLLTESELWILLKESWFTGFERKHTIYDSSLIFGVK